MTAGLSYLKHGDYQIPNIQMKETPGFIGKYGIMRKQFLKEHRKAKYNILLMKNQMEEHLMKIDREMKMKVEFLEEQLLKNQPAPDKAKDGLAWTRHMNQIHSQAEELAIQEIIFN